MTLRRRIKPIYREKSNFSMSMLEQRGAGRDIANHLKMDARTLEKEVISKVGRNASAETRQKVYDVFYGR